MAVDFRKVLDGQDNPSGKDQQPKPENIYTLDKINFASSNIKKLKKYNGKNFADIISVINVEEFQPTLEYDWFAFGTELATKGTGALLNFLKDKSKVAAVIGKSIEELDKAGLTSTVQTGAARGLSEALYASIKTSDVAKYTNENTLSLYKRLIDPDYNLHQFQLPYFDKKYLNKDGTTGWSMNTFKSNLKDNNGMFTNSDSIVNFPTVPTWTADDTGNKDAVAINLYLINDTLDALRKNFLFLKDLVSGSGWVQTIGDTTAIRMFNSMQKSPNLYRINCEGRFQYLICSQKISIEYMGAQRRISTEASNSIKYALPNMLVPDVYKIEITYESLIPNNYNTMLLVYADDNKTKLGKTNSAEVSNGSDLSASTIISKVTESVIPGGQILAKAAKSVSGG